MLDVNKINAFLQEDHSNPQKRKLKERCAASSEALKKATDQREELVKQSKELHSQIEGLNSEILKLSGMIQGQLDLISEFIALEEDESETKDDDLDG